jgi:hypothetical protein
MPCCFGQRLDAKVIEYQKFLLFYFHELFNDQVVCLGYHQVGKQTGGNVVKHFEALQARLVADGRGKTITAPAQPCKKK